MTDVAVIGCGNWGKNHLRVYSQLKNVNLKYICDKKEDLLEKYSKVYDSAISVKDYRKIIKNDDVDAVVITSSAISHYKIVKDFLQQGVNVFVEKPLTLSVKESEELINLSKKKNLVLMVGHLLIYHPAIVKIKELIQKNELGDVYYLTSQRINLGIIRKDENALWSLSPHDISIILHLFEEEPNRIMATGKGYIQESVEDVVFLSMKFPSGKMAHVHCSWLDPHKVRKMTIVGSDKMLVFDDLEPSEKIKIYNKGVEKYDYTSYGESIGLRFGDIVIPWISSQEPLKNEALHFIDCVDNGKKPITDGIEGLKVVKILEEADKQLKK